MELIARPEDLRRGDLMFGPIKGFTGAFVGLGQLLLAVAEPGMIWKQGPGKWFRIRHCGIIVEESRQLPPGSVRHVKSGQYREGPSPNVDLGDNFIKYETGVITAPRLVQAMPGGIEEIDLTYEKWTPDYIYLRPDYSPGSPFDPGWENRSQGFQVAHAARSFVGRPYDFATYPAIPLYRRGVRTKLIKEIISGTDTMMCSRTVDAALEAAGWHLFDDGRMPGNVTPSEVYRRILEMPLAAASAIKKGHPS